MAEILEDIRKRALIGDTGILEDYPESLLEEELDKFGWNAYHILAQGRKKEILKFNGTYKLRNKQGKTALEILLSNSEIDSEVLQKYFPWYTPNDGETIEESMECIKKTSPKPRKMIESQLDKRKN